MSKAKENYNKEYFDWYKKIGIFGGKINKINFERYINKEDSVLDFGCGGGYLINELKCKEKHGVEINPYAVKEAENLSIKIFKDVNELSENYYNKIISNNCLQHCENPFIELQNLHKTLKKDGLIILVVSCSSRNLKYKPNDINYQLYSWSPMNFGNILDTAGFSLVKVKKINSRWIPKYEFFYKLFGEKIFRLACFFYSLIDSSITSVIAVAKKK